MPYRIQSGEAVEEAVRRIGGEQIEGALAGIDGADADAVEAVHDIRKRCKKIRGLLRLVRPCLGDTYRRENAWFRDTARRLSGLRDLQVMGRTFDDLVASHPDTDAVERFGPLRERLFERRADGGPDPGRARALLEDVRPAFESALGRAAQWRVPAAGFDAIDGGLRLTWRRGRRGRAAVAEQASAPAVHEWRKRVKYHWYHARLLVDCWRPVMDAWCREAHQLSEDLGDAHDLAVLRQALATDVVYLQQTSTLREMLGLLDRRHDDLIERALVRGRRLYAEKPGALGRRLRGYWDAWCDEAGDTAGAPALAAAQSISSPNASSAAR